MPNSEFAHLSEIPFSHHAKEVLRTAKVLTRARGEQYVGDTDLIGALARFHPTRAILDRLGVTEPRIKLVQEKLYGVESVMVVPREEQILWGTRTSQSIRRGVGDALVNDQDETDPVNLLRGLALESLLNKQEEDHQALRLLDINPRALLDNTGNLLIFFPSFAEPILYANEVHPEPVVQEI